MRIILAIDSLVLRFFTKITKDFNWLTGLSNRAIALVFLAINHFYFFYAIFIILRSVSDLLVTGSFSFSVFCVLTFKLMSISSKPNLHEAKDPTVFFILFSFRLGVLFLAVITSVGFTIIYKKTLYSCITFAVAFIAWAYCCCVERPPFKKSRAWHKLKSWMFSSQPGLESATPVTVPNS